MNDLKTHLSTAPVLLTVWMSLCKKANYNFVIHNQTNSRNSHTNFLAVQ